MAVISFKCPNCDGELIFDPETQKYKCEYCGSKFTQAELDALQPAESEETDAGAADGSDEAEQETTEQQSADTKKKEGEDGGAEAVIYNCPSCGAEIVTDATTAATFCYYCHNPVVLGKRLEGKYLPNKVIPFKISKKEAEKRFLEYVVSISHIGSMMQNCRENCRAKARKSVCGEPEIPSTQRQSFTMWSVRVRSI